MHYYEGVYDLKAADSENPKVETVVEEAQINAVESDKPTIEEVKSVAALKSRTSQTNGQTSRHLIRTTAVYGPL